MVSRLGPGGRHAAGRLEAAAVVGPAHPAEGGELDGPRAAPRTAPPDRLGLEEADPVGRRAHDRRARCRRDRRRRRRGARSRPRPGVPCGGPQGAARPRPLWCTRPPRTGRRSCGACSRAPRTRSARAALGARQPTTRRAGTPVAEATCARPCQVATRAEPGTRGAFGCGARRRRSTLSAGQGEALPAIAVLVSSPRTAPRRPIRRIGRSTARRATARRAAATPPRPSCRQTWRAPRTPKSASCTRRTRSTRTRPRRARGEALAGSARRAARARRVGGAIGRTPRPGPAPWTSRWPPAKAAMASTGGRAPPGRNRPAPSGGSRRPGAARGSPAPRPRPAPAPPSWGRPAGPGRAPSAGPACAASRPRRRPWRRPSRWRPAGTRGRPRGPAPPAPPAAGPRAKTGSTASSSRPRPPGGWGLQQTRGGSMPALPNSARRPARGGVRPDGSVSRRAARSGQDVASTTWRGPQLDFGHFGSEAAERVSGQAGVSPPKDSRHAAPAGRLRRGDPVLRAALPAAEMAGIVKLSDQGARLSR
jgi:hypothetical protein